MTAGAFICRLTDSFCDVRCRRLIEWLRVLPGGERDHDCGENGEHED